VSPCEHIQAQTSMSLNSYRATHLLRASAPAQEVRDPDCWRIHNTVRILLVKIRHLT
jgi:hypothetical protein